MPNGWNAQTGTTSSAVQYPSRTPNETRTTRDEIEGVQQPVSGALKGVLVTDWVAAVGAKLDIYEDDGATLIHSFVFNFPGGAPDTPKRVDLDPDGLSMPGSWSYKFYTSSGQFDGILIYEEAADA